MCGHSLPDTFESQLSHLGKWELAVCLLEILNNVRKVVYVNVIVLNT